MLGFKSFISEESVEPAGTKRVEADQLKKGDTLYIPVNKGYNKQTSRPDFDFVPAKITNVSIGRGEVSISVDKLPKGVSQNQLSWSPDELLMIKK